MKKSLLGTVFLSIFSWDAMAADAAQQQSQQQNQQQSRSEYYTLADLKRICKEAEGNRQIKPFKSHFTCTETRTFWSKLGTQRFPLGNESGVLIRADMKDGMHRADWLFVPAHSETQWGTCDVVEQIKMEARDSVPITSCADLDKIVTEESFCAETLASTWANCDREVVDLSESGVFIVPESGSKHCEYTRLNIVKKCIDGDIIAPKPNCQQQQQQAQQCQVGDVACQQQAQQQTQQQCQRQQQCDLDVPCVDPNSFGADMENVVVNRGGFHKHHECVRVASTVAEGALISQLGLVQGNVVSKVDGHRVRSVKDFEKRISQARHNRVAKLEYRKLDGNWTTVTVKL